VLSSSQFKPILQQIPPQLQDIVIELRDIISTIVPGVTETANRRGFSYYFRERGGPVSAGVCQIGVFGDHVRLAFIHGAFLPDPKGLLEGAPRYKRFVRLQSYEDVPWDDLKELMIASSCLDPRSLNVNQE
jgi:hypothetical protein